MQPIPSPGEQGVAPMEARLVDALPTGDDWRFEPKWDGFRCIAYRDGGSVALRAKSGKPLDRFFPEVVDTIAQAPADHFVVDGELLISTGEALSFAALQARLHPAESRIRKLAQETPAQLMLFDCLAQDGPLLEYSFDERRRHLEKLHARIGSERIRLSPLTRDHELATRWLDLAGGALDGVVAKKGTLPYLAGERAMAKVKQHRTADCVLGGFRYARKARREVGSLLLGLYNDVGALDHVGFTSSFDAAARESLLELVEPLIGPPGFTGNAPGGPSRWSTERSTEWTPLRSELVAEVRYDQVTGGRFRHGTTFLRWRPDKAPEQCRMDQLARELAPAELEALLQQIA